MEDRVEGLDRDGSTGGCGEGGGADWAALSWGLDPSWGVLGGGVEIFTKMCKKNKNFA